MGRVRTDRLTRWQQAFFELLRSGLWSMPPATTLFPLTTDEWQQLYAEACHQTVQGIVFEGLRRLPSGLLPAPQLLNPWAVAVANIVKGNQLNAKAAAASYAMLQEAGCEPVLLKGIAVARFYPTPQRRVSGDVDWYIPATVSLTHIAEVLQRHDIASGVKSDGSLCFELDGVEIELHTQMADLESPRRQKVLAQLIAADGYDHLTLPTGEEVRTPGPMTTLILLSTHILKHTTTVGIGLRQFCDIARAYQALCGRYDKNTYNATLRRLDLSTWSQLLHTFLIHYLGLSASVLPSSPGSISASCHQLANDVLRWGNFGHSDDATQHHKLRTLSHILRRLPFALRYAPTETCWRIFGLVRGTLRMKSEGFRAQRDICVLT